MRAGRKGTHPERLFGIVDRLRGYRDGVPLAKLADDFEVTKPQIRRDVATLQRYGWEIDFEIHHGRSYVYLATKGDQASLTKRERFTLGVLTRMVGIFRHTPIHEDLEAMTSKMLGLLTDADRADMEALMACVHYIPDGGVKNYRRRVDVIDGLQTGILQARLVKYVYRSASGREERGVCAPHGIVIYRNGIYVIGRLAKTAEAAASSGAVVSRPIERFISAKPIAGSRFVKPKALRTEQSFDGAFGIVLGGTAPKRVVIEFSAKVRANILDRTFHPSQRVERLPDGRVRLRFDVRNLFEVAAWVYQWGPHAKVLEPPTLVAKVAADLKAAAEGYQAA
jgi:predicted DNA-binding transcriptional regulator YafY